MFRLQEKLFGYFGPRDKARDQRKDAQGRGTQERFMRALGAEFDAELLPLLENFVANCLDPTQALARFVPYLEQQMGVTYQVSDDLAVRRKLVAWSARLTRLKGTKRSYEILLKLMGFETVAVLEDSPVSGFDSPLRLDDAVRRFDGRCDGCTYYDLELTGGLAVTADIRAWIQSVVVFCQPINARLRSITHNGAPLLLGTLGAGLNEDGDLEYDNLAAPGTSLRLLPNGDLQVRGTDAGRYHLSPQGDLLFY